MWTTFFLGAVVVFAVLYLPGFIQLLSIKRKAALALVCAPIISLFELCIVGIILGLLGIATSGTALIFSLVGITIVVSVIGIVGSRKSEAAFLSLFRSSELAWKNIALYMGLSIVIIGYYFVRTLDGPESFVQEFDNAFHLNLIHAFIESGRFSVLQATTFPTLPIQPWDNIAYYPAAWHVIAAVCGDALNVSAEMAENFTNTIFLSVVFPTSMCAFISAVLKNNKRIIPLCGLFVCAFAAFPWGFLVAGPLYSNMAAFALVPAVMFCFVKAIEGAGLSSNTLCLGILTILGIAVLGMTQPNAVFTAVVILTPYCMVQIYNHWNSKSEKIKGYIFAAIFLLFVIFVWTALRHLGMFQGVVNYSWHPYASMQQAIFDFLDLGYRNATAQLLLAVLVLTGVLYLLYKKAQRWLLAGYLFFFVAFLSAAATVSGFHGSFFSGFWYNDVDRIAACAVLIMIIFAGVGLYALVSLLLKVIQSAWGLGNKRVVTICISLLFMGLIFAPNHILAGMGDVSTSIGSREARLAELATTEVCLTKDEERFVSEVTELIGEDAAVANFSFDGSVFTYATNDLNVLTRHYFSSDSGDMGTIQKHLNEIAYNDEVQEAVKRTNAEYVLLLDVNDSGDNSVYSAFLDENDWKGITSITDTTPGFKVVLSEGDMRLYEIEPID